MIKYIFLYSFFFIPYCIYAQQSTHRVSRGDFEFNIKYTCNQYMFVISIVEVYKKADNAKIQTIEINENGRAIWESIDWEKALIMEDENFDGFPDFRVILDETNIGDDRYSHWIFDTTTQLFEEKTELKNMYNPYFNHKDQTIHTLVSVGCCVEYEALYRFSNDTLTLLKDVHRWWGDDENNLIVSKEQKMIDLS